MSKAKTSPTRYALVKRAQKIVQDIDEYFEEASDYGLSMHEADPDGLLTGMRRGLVKMLQHERSLTGAA